MTDKIHCENCRFWADTASEFSVVKHAVGVGECRRNAPQGPRDFQSLSGFVKTVKDEWCGEAEPQ